MKYILEVAVQEDKSFRTAVGDPDLSKGLGKILAVAPVAVAVEAHCSVYGIVVTARFIGAIRRDQYVFVEIDAGFDHLDLRKVCADVLQVVIPAKEEFLIRTIFNEDGLK